MVLIGCHFGIHPAQVHASILCFVHSSVHSIASIRAVLLYAYFFVRLSAAYYNYIYHVGCPLVVYCPMLCA